MPINIVTWNTQGDPRNNANKSAKMWALHGTHDLVLVQEAGNMATATTATFAAPVVGGAARVFNVAGLPQAGAKNPRCGTAILSPHALGASTMHYLKSGTGRYGLTVVIQPAAVPPAVVLPPTIVVGTLHCESSANAGTDRTGLLNDLRNQARVLLGGDWNLAEDLPLVAPPPPPATGVFNAGTNSRPQNWTVITCGQATHQGGNQLDYFYDVGVVFVAGSQVRDGGGLHGSDHWPVHITL